VGDCRSTSDLPYWEDFGSEDWKWVAKKVRYDRLGPQVVALRSFFEGTFAGEVKRDVDKMAQDFQLRNFDIRQAIGVPSQEG